MKMISCYFVMAFMLSATLGMAQSSDEARTSFAVLGGVNLQNLNGKDFDGSKLENDLIIGFHAGVNAQIPIAPQFYFQPGLLFSTKGAKTVDGGVTNTLNLSYIELPLNVVYKAMLGNGHFMLGFGPYVGYGIAGKFTSEGVGATLKSDVEFKSTVELTDPLTTVYVKAFDAGGNIFAGYELASGIFLQFNTQFGMLSINPDDKRFPEGETAIKNTGFGVSAGYRF
jgi:hypothetical protein